MLINRVRLQVHDSVTSEAKKILGELELGSYEELVPDDVTITCQECHSEDVEEVNWIWKLAFVSLILNLLPLPFSRYHYKCNSCSFSWKERE